MKRSKFLADHSSIEKGRIASRVDDRVDALVKMLDYMMPETKKIEPIAEYFLRLARASLLEAEQKRADTVGRH